MSDIGYINPIQVIQTPDGYLIVDGHLRTGIAGSDEVDVLVLNLTPDEAKKVLLTEDTITGIATTDTEKFQTLLNSLNDADRDIVNQITSNRPIVIPDSNKDNIFDVNNLPDAIAGESYDFFPAAKVVYCQH